MIERDSKVSTYKFALLRGTIDIIQDNSPFINLGQKNADIPLGLLIEKWLLYYYPILESEIFIPQINGRTILAFEKQFRIFIIKYSELGGFSAFYNDLRLKGIPKELELEFLSLVNKIGDTIRKNPMKYIGRSFNDGFYAVFQDNNNRKKTESARIDLEFLVKKFGTFSISLEYYSAFQILGSFISGQDSLLFKWAEFSVKAASNGLKFETVLNDVLRSPVTEREATKSKILYKSILEQEGHVQCVWTMQNINAYHIDHVIPFSIWKNNDLWNLLPSSASTNNNKRDKIPSLSLIEKRKERIIQYWELIFENQPERFEKEVKVSLLGSIPFDNWQYPALERLKESCNYLITIRGFEEWNPKM
ncbi:HNH endonuclease domain-containing protein [Rhodonellum sp.]|uniref:HNH endonuclease domain-containing protein n=1 Tax=Rhodonellum sp. TaxID=2231180 RepID=UPI002729B25E|nr:HNH endonuclease domain-containing protein [Rhodonellum sp.]